MVAVSTYFIYYSINYTRFLELFRSFELDVISQRGIELRGHKPLKSLNQPRRLVPIQLASHRQPLVGTLPQPSAQVTPSTSLWGYFWGYEMGMAENTPSAPQIM